MSISDQNTYKNRKKHAVNKFLDSFRIGRIIMLALVSSSTAYGLGGSARAVAYAGICAGFLSAGGFFLDYLADWKKDRKSGKLLNPVAAGDVTPKACAVFIAICIGASFSFGILANALIVIPAAAIILVVIGLGVGILDTPILRAISLGVLQGLYVIIGGLAAQAFGLAAVLAALFLVFAMTGGRVMGDVRDLRHDIMVDTKTIPRKFGLKWAAIFLIANEIIAYGVALSVYWTGAFGPGYLYCIIVIIAAGIIINTIFVIKPTPKRANLTNNLSVGILGMLYVLAMVLGRS